MQAVNGLRLEFPADDGFDVGAAPTGDPGVDQEARRIDFEIFAVDAESGAVDADAVAGPLATDADVGFAFGEVIHVASAPPARHLGSVGDGLEDAGRRRGDETFAGHDILFGSVCYGGHKFSYCFCFSIKFLICCTSPGQPWL